MPNINVKQAVAVVREFIGELYGSQQLRYAMLEEVELSEDEETWFITMSVSPPSSLLTGSQREETDLKLFRVDAETGDVLSMKIKE